MDHDRFDTLTRNLVRAASRRGLLSRFASSALAAMLFTPGDEAAAKSCPPCRKKKRGRCRKKRPDGTPCGACRACQDGRCADLPLGTSCGTGKSCQGGVCAACDSGLTPCTPGPGNTCCSGKCSQAQPDVFLCEPHCREEGTTCIFAEDCCPGLGCEKEIGSMTGVCALLG
jgi:hypothetical protein